MQEDFRKQPDTKLMNFKGENIPAIAVVNYGNINIGDALIELNDILKENGFTIVGTGATVSQHSIVTDVAQADRMKKIWKSLMNL